MELPIKALCSGCNSLPAHVTLFSICLIFFERRSALRFLHGTSTFCPWAEAVPTGLAACEKQKRVGELLELAPPGALSLWLSPELLSSRESEINDRK